MLKEKAERVRYPDLCVFQPQNLILVGLCLGRKGVRPGSDASSVLQKWKCADVKQALTKLGAMRSFP